LIALKKKIMEVNQERIKTIYDSLKLFLPSVQRVIFRKCAYSGWCYLVLPWDPLQQEKGGFAITVPRNMNPDKYLCETCLINANGILYSDFPGISWVLDMEELMQVFYSSYLWYRCLQGMCHKAVAFQLSNSSAQKKKTPSSLMTLCLQQLSTSDLHHVRNQIMLVCC
jgi:hypothetical protein